jgi:putative glutamine amidotransferase
VTSPRPRIAVTGPDRGGLAAWLFTARAIRRAGGDPIRVQPKKPFDDSQMDGLVIGGGADVGSLDDNETEATTPRGGRWPAFLSTATAPFILLLRLLLRRAPPAGVDPARDRLENQLLKIAETKKLPVLGICRGGQLLNAFAGGSLHLDLSFYAESPTLWTVLPVKPIEIEPASRLRNILGTDATTVNSLHRQAINQAGADLLIVARDRYGIVQAIEHRDRPFWIGVQWHPEYLQKRPEQRALFTALVQAANSL